MAKIELTIDSAPKNQKKRKLKDDSQTVEAESPSSKFKKLDISQIGVKKSKSSNMASSTTSSSASPKKNNKEPSSTATPKSPKPMIIEPSSSVVATPSTSKSVFSVNKRKAEAASVSPNSSKNNKKPRTIKQEPVDDQEDFDNDDDDDDDGGDDADYEPSTTELQAADHPENTPNIETTRQKKKAKSQKVAETAKVDSAVRDSIRNLQYLRLWKNDRVAWKYQKLRQLSIQKSLFRVDEPMDDEMWDLALEYLSGSQGQSRRLLVEAAEKVINETDERINVDNQQELVSEQMYTRARELLQMFQ